MDTPADSVKARLVATFAGEAEERVHEMNRGVLRLEGGSDPVVIEALLEDLLRHAHSLKGAARAVDAHAVETVAHWLENLFDLLRSGELDAEPAVCDVILHVLDAIGALACQATGGEPAQVDLTLLMSMLEDPRRGLIDAPHPQAPDPPFPVAEQPASETAAQRLPAPPPPPPPVTAPPTLVASTLDLRPETPAYAAQKETVRVSTAKLDALLAAIGELVVANSSTQQRLAELRVLADELEAWEARLRRDRWRSRAGRRPPAVHYVGVDAPASDEHRLRLRDARSRLTDLHRALRGSAQRVARLTAELDDDVRRSRMLPVSTVVDAFPRMVRDIAREEAKEVAVIIEGAETEIDRSLLEELRAPLTHLIRNSIDHGIEAPEARERAGKSRQGRITIRAEQQGSTLVINVSDDGAGIDLLAVRRRAVEYALISAEEAERLDDRDALELIFRSGFSTAPVITDLSGRGVGLDVVRETIERLHGVLDVNSMVGTGTRLSLRLPLSVATTACLLLSASGQLFALPITNVSRIVPVTPQTVDRVEGRPVVRDEAGLVALAWLADVLGVGAGASIRGDQAHPAIVLGSGQHQTAFVVDALLGLEDVVTKALPAPLLRVRHLAGATVLGTGEIVPILNASDLVRTASPMRETEDSTPSTPRAKLVVLVVEDSPTTRALHNDMLEHAGHEVRAVGDGVQAWAVVREGGIDGVVSDIHMPGMDGFELTKLIRADKRVQGTPVILVTYNDSPSYRERAAEVGANALIVKGTQDQRHLVDAVERIVRPR